MRHWQEIKESPNYPLLKGSVELRHTRSNLLIHLGCTLFCGLMVAAALSVGAEGAAIGMAVAAILLVLLPSALFYACRLFMIFHRIHDYTFTEVVLDKPHSGMLRDTMYFSVVVKTPGGSEAQADTHSIFTLRGIPEPRFEDYVNQKITVAYNSTTEYVVVIGFGDSVG